MVQLRLEGAEIVLQLSGIDVLLALKRRLSIPVQLVQSARIEKMRVQGFAMSRLWGTYLPRVFAAGTFAGGAGRRNFYCARHGKDVLVLEASGGPFARYVVQLESPHDAVAQLGSLVTEG